MHITGFTVFLTVLFIVISVLMIMIILVQRGRGGGLAGAFGAGGGGNTAFGTKTGDVFTTVTVVFFVLFMLLAIYLNRAYQPPEKRIGGATPGGTLATMNAENAGATGTEPPATTSLPATTQSTQPSTTTAPAATTTTTAPVAPKATIPVETQPK